MHTRAGFSIYCDGIFREAGGATVSEPVPATWRRGLALAEARRHASDPEAPAWLARRVHLAGAGRDPRREVVVLCIGTDRSTGDALGPLVGTHLVAGGIPWRVYGTVEEPVHATNLAEVLAGMEGDGRARFVIAVDACLGRAENVGTIAVAPGPLAPGAGVMKALPPVGDVAVTGTVNVGGFMEYLILQNTRLAVVLRIARAIAEGLLLAAHIGRHPAGESAARAARPTASHVGHEDGERAWHALEASGQSAHELAVGVDREVGRTVDLDCRGAPCLDLGEADVRPRKDER